MSPGLRLMAGIPVSHEKLLKIITVAVALLSVTLGALRFNSFQTGAWVDDAHYIVLAESIATGRGYTYINDPQAPPGHAFPPGWPMMLAPWVALFPNQMMPLKLLSLALWVGFTGLFYYFLAGRLAPTQRLVAFALTVLNPMLVGISVMVMSEAAYLFFSFLALALMDKLDAARPQPHLGWLVALSATIIYTQLLRTLGLALLLAVVLHWMMKRQLKSLAVFLMILAVSWVPQIIINASAGGSVITAANQS